MTPIFVDTVGLIALWNRSDQWHAAATAAFAQLTARRTPLVTSALVLLECGNEASRRPYRHRVVELRHALRRLGRVIEPNPEQMEAAWAAYERREAGSAGIVDHVSFVLMRAQGLTEAFTNDAHFRAAGFQTLF